MAFDMLMKLTAGALWDRCMLGYVPGVSLSVWSTWLQTNGAGSFVDVGVCSSNHLSLLSQR